MTATTTAAVVVGPRQVDIQQFPLPDPKPDTALVQVLLCGVCGADWPRYTGERMGDTALPVILGHEIVGTVAAIGELLAARLGIHLGDMVLVEEPRPCMQCSECAAKDYFGCASTKYGGTSTAVEPSLWGGYAEHIHLDSRAIVHKLDPRVPADAYSVAIPVANGLHWTQVVGQLGVGETLLVQGPGQHGLGCVYAGQHLGAGRVIVAGRPSDALRLEMAERLGATDIIMLSEGESLSDRVADLTGGRMADVVVQVASASATAFIDALHCAAVRGRVVSAGFAGTEISFNPDVLIQRQLTVTGVRGRPSEFTRKAIELIGRHPEVFQQLVTHTYALADTEQALLTVGRERDADSAVHVNVRPGPRATDRTAT
jgi:threonine dehydrogenase-like Zn-dependent dehydrogenase